MSAPSNFQSIWGLVFAEAFAAGLMDSIKFWVTFDQILKGGHSILPFFPGRFPDFGSFVGGFRYSSLFS